MTGAGKFQALAAWAVFAVWPMAGQAGAAKKVDFEKMGPAVGAKMPDFSAEDEDGQVRNLKSLLGPKGALVLIFRSADW